MPSKPGSFNVQQVFSIVVLAGLASAGGCQQAVNPFVDNLPPASTIDTASVREIRANPTEVTPRKRGWSPAEIRSEDHRVMHWPVYDSDGLIDFGDGDDRFALTWLDYGAFLYAPLRQGVNLVGLPVSVIVDPPWATHTSDGVISAQTFGMVRHDVSPGHGG